MALLTLAEVRTLLQIPAGDTTRDTLIETILPMVQKRIVEYCNNGFVIPTTQVYATTISFSAGTPAKIKDSGSGFVKAGFTAGCDVKVQGSAENDGIYTVETVAPGELALAIGETLNDEAAFELITVTRVRWPKDLKLDAAQIVNYFITTQGKLVTQEGLPGGYSVTFKSDAEVWAPLRRYRRPFK
jgi:hypothetical protein